jgi:hypothetical protein
MNADARAAIARLGTAYAELGRVLSLPTEIGARIQWRGNGLIWTRVGEDAWQPQQDPAPGFPADETWPSAHIASDAGWTTDMDETAGGIA